MAISEPISKLPPLTIPDSADLIPVVDVSAGVTKRTTVGSSAVYNQGDTGAVDRTVESRLRDSINVNDYGATPSAIDNAVAIQAAEDALTALGGGFLHFGSGTYLSSQITKKDRIVWVGEGSQNTAVKAIDGLNDNLILSLNFATLTGTNVWLGSEGVLEFVGFKDIRIDGNKANQTAGDGIRLYAKGLFFDNLVVHQCFANGIFTEAGESGTVGSFISMPEGQSGLVQLINNGTNGWHMRGPHDLYAAKITSAINGQNGVFVESSAGNFLASTDFSSLHCYSNGARGLRVKSSVVRAGLMRLENSDQEGLFLEGSSNCEIGTLHLFDNCQVSQTFQGVVDSTSDNNTFGEVLIRRSGRTAVGGFQLAGSSNVFTGRIKGDVTGGGNSTSLGFDLPNTANFNTVNVNISDFSGVGGTALRTANGGANGWNHVTAVLQNSSTLWNNVTAGNNNRYEITGNTTSGATTFTGVGPTTTKPNRELFNVTLRDASPDVVLSEEVISDSVDLNSISEQTLTISHNLLAVPLITDVQATLSYTGTNTTFVIQYIKVHSVSATQIVCRVKLSTAAGSVNTGTLSVYVRL